MTSSISNPFCILLSFLVTLASCNQEQTRTKANPVDTTGRDTIHALSIINSSKEKVGNNIGTKLDSSYPCQLAHPDTSVYEVKINDAESSIKQLGEKFEPIENAGDMPYESFCTSDKQQTLKVFFHYGDVRNEFSEFEVLKYSAKDKATILPANNFITNNGIKLGLSKEKLTELLGKCFKTSGGQNNSDIIRYRIDDFRKSKFLQRNNMPVYYAEYEFRDNLLVRFRFGFEYP